MVCQIFHDLSEAAGLNIERHWYRDSLAGRLLAPLGWCYCLLATLRRAAYRAGLLRSVRLPAPVVVVGNISVGGTGKTPLVIWLARFLKSRGYRPGIVTRGYGGRAPAWPQVVAADSDPGVVGEEPVLLARGAGCPVVADPDRVRAARALLNEQRCDVIVSDDGLQHYRLARTVEIAVIDGARRFGNGRCLPAGPLREPVGRLEDVHARVTLGAPQAGELGMELIAHGFVRLGAPQQRVQADHFRGGPAHAVAGIGHPARFFAHLRRLGLEVIEHPFPDHHVFRAGDTTFGDGHEIIMTEKDAVKCERLAGVEGWYLVVEARPEPRLGEIVLQLIRGHARG